MGHARVPAGNDGGVAGGTSSRAEESEMKSSLRSWQDPRRVSNGVIISAMLLSLRVLSIVKARYCATPFRACKADDHLHEQMNSSIRMEPEESSPARMPGGIWR